MVRVTFSLPEATVAEIRKTAARLGAPQSHIVRDAVAGYAARSDRMSEAERLHKLKVLDDFMRQPPTRSARAGAAEIRAIRAARRAGGRQHRSS